MKLEYLIYLPEIDRLRSISSAAALFHIPQTTLSAAVNAIENELGFHIFQRTPAGVTPTAEGRELIDLAREIAVQYEELTRLKKAPLFIPTIPVLASPHITNAISLPLAELFYRFEIRGNLFFEEHPSSDIFSRLLDHTASIGVAFLSPGELELLREPVRQNHMILEEFFSDRMYLLTAPDHPFAHRESVGMAELLSARIAMVSARKYDKLLGRFFLECNQVVTFADVNLVRDAVLTGKYVALSPRFGSGWESGGETGLCCIPLTDTERENRLRLCLLHYEDHLLRLPERIVVSGIREILNEWKAQNLSSPR